MVLGVFNQTTPLLTPEDPNWLPPESEGIFPSKFSAFETYQLEEMASKYKLTPATLAFHLENLRIPIDSPLKWYPAPFLLNISAKIAQGVAKGNARILISAPPRHGKSRISTIHGPLWILENFPNKNVVVTSYGADLAEDFSREVRDFIKDNPDQLEVRIRKDADRISKFLTNKDGALTAIGIGGPITGRGADVLLIDDYIKQIKEANSPTYRQQTWDWFTTTAMTRLEPNASVIIVATRWHHDDLIGRILKNFPDDWEHIKYHAIAREKDNLGRAPGEALFPQRYSVKTLNSRQALLGTFYYDALFDQEPHDSTGDLTDKSWIKVIEAKDIPERPFRLVRVWDFAGTESASADYTAGALIAGDPQSQECYLLNMIRQKNTAAKNELLVTKTAESDGPSVEIVICQETGSAGKAVVEHYKSNVLSGYKVTGHYWNQGKVIIAQPWLACVENGHFYMLRAPWNKAFLDEFETFPSEGSGFHDDQMDVCANGYIKLFGKKRLGVTIGRRKPSDPNNPSALSSASSPEQAAALLAKQAVNSPHRLLKHSKAYAFGSLRRATFGRRQSDIYHDYKEVSK